MTAASRRRRRLDRELLALGDDAMPIEQLDGLIAGVLVCPELISPADWLPVIWGQNADGPAPFEDVDHANFVFGLIMDYYNDVVLTLTNRPDRYRPLFPIHRNEILWELWIEGFAEAVRLRPDAWQRFLDADAETSDVMVGMLALIEVAGREHDLPRELVDDLTVAAPELIPGWITALNNWRLANNRRGPRLEPSEAPPSAAAAKVGRNEPCRCGSGKKYKKCCGLN